MANDPVTAMILDVGRLRREVVKNTVEMERRVAGSEASFPAFQPFKETVGALSKLLDIFEEEMVRVSGKTWDEIDAATKPVLGNPARDVAKMLRGGD